MKKRAKPARSKAPRKGTTKPRAKASARPDTAPAAIEPSLTRGHVTAARMGRPRRLTRELIARFIAKLSLGMHLETAAAIVGIGRTQLLDWLRDGRRDIDADPPRASVEADFSDAVDRELARLQEQELGALAVYQRMAEGWSPTCPRCIAKSAPCGRHRKNLKLAADLARWRLTHRFPARWNASHVRHELGSRGDDEGGAGIVPPGAGDGADRPAVMAAMVVFMPKRNDPGE